MKRHCKAITILSVAILALVPAARAQNAKATMTIWKARRALPENIAVARIWGPMNGKIDPNSFRITEDRVEFDGVSHKRHFVIDLTQLGSVTVGCRGGHVAGCTLRDTEGKKLSSELSRLFWNDYTIHLLTTPPACSPECERQANVFADALNKLSSFAIDKNNPLHDFSTHAAEWRALATKPPLPDAVRVRRLMAEDSLKNQKPQDALTYYEQGLEIYSLWPEGWYNASLVAGALSDYSIAIEFMRNYLLLVPNAADAQAAHDQIEIWKIKAGQ
jgi:tetratricopeptide (TPR) repeat protein